VIPEPHSRQWRVYTLAIHRVEPDETLAEILIDVLKIGWHLSIRMDAAIGLRGFCSEESERALLGAIEHDVAYLVRCNAFLSVMVRWKEMVDKNERKEISELIASPNAALNRGDVMTEDYQRNLTKARERLEKLKDEYVKEGKAM
jgi:hypothetical protein